MSNLQQTHLKWAMWGWQGPNSSHFEGVKWEFYVGITASAPALSPQSRPLAGRSVPSPRPVPADGRDRGPRSRSRLLGLERSSSPGEDRLWLGDRPTAASEDARTSDSAPTAHACCIARSRLFSSEDRLFSWVYTGVSLECALSLRAVFWPGNGAPRR